jgi:hypothetical protein
MPLSKTVTELVFKYKRKMGHLYFVGNRNWSQGRKSTRCSVNERNGLLWYTTGTYLFAKWLWWWEDLRDENASYMGLGKHVVTVLLNCLETNAWREAFYDQLDQLREPHFRGQQSARVISYSCAQRLISIFGATYSCESLYSTLKLIRSKYRSVLTDGHTLLSLY